MSFLKRERHGHVLLCTMDSADTRNALTGPEQLAFCAGGNVKDMRDRKGLFSGAPFAQANSYRNGIQRIPRAIVTLDVPIIAAVNGPAVGAGCDLATMCDILIASTKAKFAESFIKLGIIPGDGGAWFLPRAVGYSNACKMAFTGDMISADEALTMGLVSEVVAPEALIESCLELAQRIAANPPHAIRLTKQLLRASQESSMDELLEKSAAYQALCHAEPDHAEAVTAFFEKRAGDYKGSSA